MVGVFRSSLAAGALFVSPGPAVFNQASSIEAPPGVIKQAGLNHQAKKPEEVALPGGHTLDEILAMLALQDSVTSQINNTDRNFGLPPKRIGRTGVHVGFSAVGRIIRPNRYTNWSNAPISPSNRNLR